MIALSVLVMGRFPMLKMVLDRTNLGRGGSRVAQISQPELKAIPAASDTAASSNPERLPKWGEWNHTMNWKHIAACSTLTLACLAHGQDYGLEGPYGPSRWSGTGFVNGTTTVRETVEMFYDVVDPFPADGVPFRTTEFRATAANSGVLHLFYDARFRHQTFSREFYLRAFAEGPDGVQGVLLVDEFDPAGSDLPANYEGTVSLNTHAGYEYGFIMGGGHFNSSQNLNGNLVLIELPNSTCPLQRSASQWSAGPILEGMTGVRAAVQFDYHTYVSPGVPVTTDFLNYALDAGNSTFNYSFRGNHAFFRAEAVLKSFSSDGTQELTQDLFDGDTSGEFFARGRTTVAMTKANPFGVRVGGENFDAVQSIAGTVVLSRFTATATEECTADLDGNGVLNFFDVSAYLGQYSSGCP